MEFPDQSGASFPGEKDVADGQATDAGIHAIERMPDAERVEGTSLGPYRTSTVGAK